MRVWLGYGLALVAVTFGPCSVFAQERTTGSRTVFELADGTETDDPAKAFETELAATLAAKPPVQSHLDALLSIVEHWAALDPPAVAAAVEGLAKTHTAGVLREPFGEITGRHWAERDPDAAIAWATRLGQLSVWSGVLRSIAATDPRRALAVASGVPTRSREELVNVVIAAIAADDPAAAAAHWQTAGLADLSRTTANEIARAWVSRDRAAAEAWALGLPAGDGRDAALADIVTLGMLDSAHAAELVNQIRDESARAIAASAWLRSARERHDPTVADFESRLVLSPAARADLDSRLGR